MRTHDFMPDFEDVVRAQQKIAHARHVGSDGAQREAIAFVRGMLVDACNRLEEKHPHRPTTIPIKSYREHSTAEALKSLAGYEPQRDLRYRGRIVDAASFHLGMVASVLDLIGYPDTWERPI